MTAAAETRTNRILIIDDNADIHADIRKVLRGPDAVDLELEKSKALLFGESPAESPSLSFQIDSAFQGQEGLEKVRQAAQEGNPYAMAFVDVRMPPGWDGVETIVHLWKCYPELQVVICTAYSDYSWEDMIHKLGHSPSLVVLKKPFDNIEVLQLAHAMTDKWHLNRQVKSQLTNLDTLVRQRTSELETANEQLKREITARIEAEGVMRLSEERFSKAFRASPIPLAIQSLDSEKLVDANDAFLAMLGGTRNEIVNRTPGELQMWPNPELTKSVFENLRDQLSIRNQSCDLQTLNGQTRHALLSIEPFESGAGPHLLMLLQDITDHLKLEDQLRQSQKMEAVGLLAAGVAHDFNNILTAIHGHASLLQNQLGDQPPHGRSLTVISLAAERATRLVRQLLAFSRKQVLKPQSLQLDVVAANLGDMLKRILGDHITLEVKTDPSIPPVKADLSMMEQIILNLAVNARDAMPRGGKLSLHVRAVNLTAADTRKFPEIKPGSYVSMQVTDTGCGIPQEFLSRIFDPFFTTKEIGKGTGLGLATVYGIVKQHSGCVRVQSAVGQGSTFEIFLPSTNEATTGEISPPAGATVADSRSGSECILLVEDEDLVRSMAGALLRGKGYRILEAGSGKEALALFEIHREAIDLVFTDVMMPGNMLGDELAARVRALKPSVPVMFTSGYTPDMADIQLRNELFFLPKPFTPSQMLEQIQRCLEHARKNGACD